SSCAAVALLLATFGLDMFPNLILSNPGVANSLTVYNAASSQKTLKIMLMIAAIGMPLVIAYTASIYWIFRGKVKLTSHSY
ncbi:MAG: cytochrome d ubiquinol oxidase subunit II, partial [candidate division Zixibacteria bacterium]|nr:cytochrome d ubiquinol oxidase subunit II [candidate division Zixibacteria bacterium]